MKKKDPALWAALRIHRILSQAHARLKANLIPSLLTLRSEMRLLERRCRMLDTARDRIWTHAADMLQQGLISQIAAVHAASTYARPKRLPELSDVPDILREIQCLEDEFDVVKISPKEKYISVTTDEITLKNVHLGAFSIRLRMDVLAQRRDVSVFSIIAESANRATSDSACTHPHVRDESLCAGDAMVPISNALADGRLSDAFQLVSRVLHTYNDGSPYVALENWDGRKCGDCGELTPADSLYSCDHCNRDMCDNCISCCDGCNESVCLSCSGNNKDGERLCPRCQDLDDEEAEDADIEDEPPVEEAPQAPTTVPDDPIHVPTNEEEPQPSTETIHEQSHSNSDSPASQPPEVQLAGGASGGDGRTVTVDVSPPLAA